MTSPPIIRAVAPAALLLVAVASARAAPCPAEPPAGFAERRTAAGDWFSAGETAERAHDDLAAIAAYRCSMKMVAHPFTAYNLARAAERSGDLELAIDAYHQYLTLKPEAEERAAIEERVHQLEQRLSEVKETGDATPAGAPAVPLPPLAPTQAPPDPGPVTVVMPADPPPRSSPTALGTGGWIVAGLGAAALVTATALNVAARGKMDDCRAHADAGDLAGTRQACHAARSDAYASYALFGAAAVAAAVDLALVWRIHGGETVALAPLPGGGRLTLARRF
jgi:tetratricopeptide (TPR) repeat protein